MSRELFDRNLRALQRDRAALIGPELFLFDRAIEDCLDRIQAISRPFNRTLLIGCPSADWPERLQPIAGLVDVVDPGPRFAAAAGGVAAQEDRHDFGESRYDLCVAVGTLDTVNDLALALQLVRRALRPEAPFIGAVVGGNSFPALRSALIKADRVKGQAVARTHPRIEAASLAGLLASAGFSMPVVDVERVTLRYSNFEALVRDLRAMAGGNCLAERWPLSRAAAARAADEFAKLRVGGKTEELVEILHFLAWS